MRRHKWFREPVIFGAFLSVLSAQAQVLAAESPVATQTDKPLSPNQSILLEECCSLGSYDSGRPDQFIIKSPVTMILEDFSHLLTPQDNDAIVNFVGDIASTAGIHIDINPPQVIPFGSKLGIVVLPPHFEDITKDDRASWQRQFGFLDAASISGSAPKGVQNIIDEVYTKNVYAIVHVRGVKDGNVAYALFFLKPGLGISILKLIKIGILEGVGFNVDFHVIPDSIFAQGNDDIMSPDDKAVLRYLYQK